MRSRLVVPLLVFALAGGAFVFIYMRSAPRVEAQEQMVEVLMSKAPIRRLTYVADDKAANELMQRRRYRTGDALPSWVTTANAKDKLLERTFVLDIPANVPITEDMLSATTGQVGTSAAVTPGMRLITLDVGISEGVQGFVGPGSKVDIVLTTTINSQSLTFPVLQNVKVFAYGALLAPDPKKAGQANAPQRNATFEVSPEDAAKLHAIRRAGRFTLTLRNDSDEEIVKIDPITIRDVLESAGIVEEEPEADKKVEQGFLNGLLLMVRNLEDLEIKQAEIAAAPVAAPSAPAAAAPGVELPAIADEPTRGPSKHTLAVLDNFGREIKKKTWEGDKVVEDSGSMSITNLGLGVLGGGPFPGAGGPFPGAGGPFPGAGAPFPGAGGPFPGAGGAPFAYPGQFPQQPFPGGGGFPGAFPGGGFPQGGFPPPAGGFRPQQQQQQGGRSNWPA